jgi:hypothetical protein
MKVIAHQEALEVHRDDGGDDQLAHKMQVSAS